MSNFELLQFLPRPFMNQITEFCYNDSLEERKEFVMSGTCYLRRFI